MVSLVGSHAYPRPQLRRQEWLSLNGMWDFATDVNGALRLPSEIQWDKKILVPFAPETPRSGVGDVGFFRACWYRQTLPLPKQSKGSRTLLHFGAVDYSATVWVNGSLAGTHEGGYTPFSFDITDLLKDTDQDLSRQEIVVRAEDDPHDLAKPRGKQDWQLAPHSIWYPRTTGIWQTVWVEQVPSTWIESLRWTPNLDRWEISFECWTQGARRDDLVVALQLSAGDRLLVNDSYAVVSGEVHRRIALSDPGIDDFRNELLWCPSSPKIIQANIQLRTQSGEVLEDIQSYTALRSVNVQGDRFMLNGRPLHLRMVLDQGVWEQTGLTAPDDAALKRDVELAKAMGFNGVRKHQKIEDPRYLYWADMLGLMVWEEMPSAYRFTKHSVGRVLREWVQAITRDISHPCIIAWVPFNESWGVPNLPNNPSERHYVQALYHTTRTLDPSRPVVGNDGWESVATDIIGIHDYDDDITRLARRYHSETVLPKLFKQERPAGRALMLGEYPDGGHPLVLSEFGGIACVANANTAGWGYSNARTADELRHRYTDLLSTVRSLGILSGFCYTQFTDTYQEVNGLLYMDRTPKFPLADISAATTGVKAVQVADIPKASPSDIVPLHVAAG